VCAARSDKGVPRILRAFLIAACIETRRPGIRFGCRGQRFWSKHIGWSAVGLALTDISETHRVERSWARIDRHKWAKRVVNQVGVKSLRPAFAKAQKRISAFSADEGSERSSFVARLVQSLVLLVNT
jgi:hypothetical protein